MTEGKSTLGVVSVAADPGLSPKTLDLVTTAAIQGGLVAAARPSMTSPVVGKGKSAPKDGVATDASGKKRPEGAWTIGALEP